MCFYMRPRSRVLHKEDCQYLQGPGVKELHLCQICFQRWWLYLGCLFGKRPAQRSATTCFGLITKGLEDNAAEELLEPWSSEAKIPSWKAFEKQIWNVVSVCFGLCLNDPSLRGLGFPRSQARSVDTWYTLEVYPNTQNSGSQDRDQRKDHWHQFPLLRWDDDDKRETVSNTKVSKRQTFSNKTLCRSCELSFKVVGYSDRWLWGMVCWSPLFRCHCPMMIKRWSQRGSFLIKQPSIWGHFKTQDVSSFLCASS